MNYKKIDNYTYESDKLISLFKITEKDLRDIQEYENRTKNIKQFGKISQACLKTNVFKNGVKTYSFNIELFNNGVGDLKILNGSNAIDNETYSNIIIDLGLFDSKNTQHIFKDKFYYRLLKGISKNDSEYYIIQVYLKEKVVLNSFLNKNQVSLFEKLINIGKLETRFFINNSTIDKKQVEQLEKEKDVENTPF